MRKLSFIIISTLCVLLVTISCSKEAVMDVESVNEVGFDNSDIVATKAGTEVSNSNYWIENGITSNYLKGILGGENKFNACQLPDSVLCNISTTELVNVCITFPLRYDYLLTNNEDYAIEYIIENFNGYQELLKRPDGPTELIKAYANHTSTSIVEQLTEAYIELICCNEEVYSKFNTQDRLTLAKTLNAKVSSKLQNDISSLSRSRADKLYNKLTEASVGIIRNNDEESPGSGLIIRQTPFGKVFQAYQCAELDDSTLTKITNKVLSTYNVELLGNSTASYNCHGYAWPSGNGEYINMDGADVSKFFTDDLFHLSNSNNCQVIHYYNGDHSARQHYTDLNGTYVSKWFNGPLVRHHYSEVPANYKPSYRRFYSYPYIIGQSIMVELNTVYTYTLYPYMSYATYEWSLPDQRETNYEIISASGNTLQIKFKRYAIYDINCDIRSASTGNLAYTAQLEVLAE